MSQPTNLYRHFASDGALLYVGISLSAVARLAQHNRNSEWAPEIAKVEVEAFASRAEALMAEKLAILAECPQWNVKHGRVRGRRLDRPEMKLGEKPTPAERIKASGLSDREISEETGANNATVWRWRHGHKQPGVMHINRLAAVLGCTPADIRPDLAEVFK